MLPAKVVATEIQLRNRSEDSKGTPWLVVQYRYDIGEEPYFGVYEESVTTEAEGEHLIRSFRQGPLYVRYHPTRHAENFMDPYRDV